MIGHQAIGMDSMFVSFYALLQKKKEPAAVLFIKKYIIATVTPEDNMVTGTWIMESGFSCHGLWT
jgi:hypothetical protein